MSLRRAAGVALASLLVGCSLLTGASDLEVDGPVPDPPETTVPGAPEASLPPAADSGRADGPAADVDASGDASTRLRVVTFEDGSLTGSLGADTKIGTPVLVSNGVLDGKYSAALDVNDGLEIAFGPAVNEIFATFLISINALGVDTPVFARLGSGAAPGASAIDLALAPDRSKAILVKVGAVSFGPAGVLDPNTTYRIGVHAQTIGASYKVEVFLARKGLAFGNAVVSGTTSAGGGAKLTYLRLGAFLGGNLKCYLDDIYVDTASMPTP